MTDFKILYTSSFLCVKWHQFLVFQKLKVSEISSDSDSEYSVIFYDKSDDINTDFFFYYKFRECL